MSIRLASTQLVSGILVSAYAGHGIRGDQVASTGTHGASPLYAALSLPADAAKEYRWRISTPVSGGTLTPFENGSFSFVPPGDGVYTFGFIITEDGVDLAATTGTITVGAGDTTAPTLSGPITIGTVASTSIGASWPAGADNVAVLAYDVSTDGSTWSSVGNVTTYTFTGLTPSTSYTLRVRARDAAGNTSTPITATQSTSAAPDTTPPTLGGPITIGAVTSASIGASWAAGSDNVAVVAYDVSTNGTTWIDIGNVTTHTFTGLLPSTSYTLRVRARDAAGNTSTPITATQSTSAAGDTTAPTLTGSITITGLTSDGYTANWLAGTDNVAVVGYDVSLNGGSSWTDVGNVLAYTATGRTPESTDLVRVRARDAAGNLSTPVLATAVTLPAATAATEPVTVAEAKAAARCDPDDASLDETIATYITAARQIAEQETGRWYVQQSKRFNFTDWPSTTTLLPVPYATDVAVQYWDGTDWVTLTTPDAYAWAQVGNTAAIAPALGTTWPTLGQVAIGPRVRVNVTAGSATPHETAPRCVKTYILATVAFWISNPEAAAASSLAEVPLFARLLDSERIWGA